MKLADLPSHEGKRVALVGGGFSGHRFLWAVGLAEKPIYDEVWTINHMGKALKGWSTLIFHMDDLKCDERFVGSMYELGIPVMTSTAYEEFPNSVAYPIQDIWDAVKLDYFETTVDYAIAFAVWRRVGWLELYGCDFTSPDNTLLEEGRTSAEFWLGFTAGRGVKFAVVAGSTLMGCDRARKLYGYAEQPTLERDGPGALVIDRDGHRIVDFKTLKEQADAA